MSCTSLQRAEAPRWPRWGSTCRCGTPAWTVRSVGAHNSVRPSASRHTPSTGKRTPATRSSPPTSRISRHSGARRCSASRPTAPSGAGRATARTTPRCPGRRPNACSCWSVWQTRKTGSAAGRSGGSPRSTECGTPCRTGGAPTATGTCACRAWRGMRSTASRTSGFVAATDPWPACSPTTSALQHRGRPWTWS